MGKWIDKKQKREGMYCPDCGMVFYAPCEISREIRDDKCVVCKTGQLLWITDGFQPKVWIGKKYCAVCHQKLPKCKDQV